MKARMRTEKGLTYGDLKQGDPFRFPEENKPMLRTRMGWYYLGEAEPSDVYTPSHKAVIRIRPVAVEDGEVVFEDAA